MTDQELAIYVWLPIFLMAVSLVGSFLLMRGLQLRAERIARRRRSRRYLRNSFGRGFAYR